MRKRGFTLIELLIVVALIGVIVAISVYGYSAYINISKNKAKNIETEQLIDAGSIYYKEFKNTDGYSSYTDEDGTTYSCISVYSLINKGYYKEDISFLNEELTKDNTVIKVKEVNGVSSYELITNYEKDKDCVYYDYTNQLDNDTEIIMNNNDNSDVTLTTTITKNPKTKNSYILKLKFTADIYKQITNYIPPAYVLILLDSSGSMVLNDRYTPAVNSAINLSQSLVNNLDDSYIALVNFDYKSYIRRDFQHNILSNSDFKSSVSGQLTNILSSLDTAYNLMSQIDNNNIKYVILLTDGVPAIPSYSSTYYDSQEQYEEYSKCANDTISETCKNTLIEYANKIKQDTNSTLVTIGYDIKNDVYKIISSIDSTDTRCPDSEYTDSSGNNYCYYYSTSSNISNLFNNISTSIEQTVKSQSVSESIVNISFDKSIKLYDTNGNEVNNLSIDINLDEPNSENILIKEYEYIIYVDQLDDTAFICDYEEEECTYSSSLFENYYVELYDENKNYLSKLEIESLPVITINKKLQSYIN